MNLIQNKLIIRHERAEEQHTVEEITREAHWEGNWEARPAICDTHLLVHKLRQSPAYLPELHYVAELAGKLVGHIMYATSKIIDKNEKEYEVLTFGPLSVLPDFQNQGIGKALVSFTLGEAKRLGFSSVFIFGHPDYYPRLGFRRAAVFGIATSDGNNFDPFIVFPLYEDALDGINGRFHLDPVYADYPEDEIVAFDKNFPPKELHIPIPMSVLLDRLPHSAKEALTELQHKSLNILTTKSQREISSLDGIDCQSVEVIRATMFEYGLRWGE